MQRLLSACTLRLNHQRKLTGHLFSGRYKALLVDGSGNGYLKTVCDYVHLNPARAGILASEERLLALSLEQPARDLAAREHRPPRIRTERLLGAHGLQTDTAASRLEFELRMEARRRAEANEDLPAPRENDWSFGSDEFRARILEQMETSGKKLEWRFEARGKEWGTAGLKDQPFQPNGFPSFGALLLL